MTTTPLPGIQIITPQVFSDDRGYFYETYKNSNYKNLGLPHFVQDNFSRSKKNVIRGLHYQQPNAQAKLVGVTYGKVWDVVVDLRLNSPTFGQWFSVIISDENHLQMYIPEGFAHGFCVLSDTADFYYKCSHYYAKETEKGIAWDDPDLNISWPISNPILSPKDTTYPILRAIPDEQLFT